MTVRSTPKHHGAAATAARTPFAAPLAAVLLTLLLCAFPLLSAHAEEPAKDCPPGQVCQVLPSVSPPPVTPAPAPTETAAPEPAPVIQQPAPVKPPVATPAPTVQVPGPSATADMPTPDATASAPSAPPATSTWTPSAGPTVDSGWTKPIDDGKEATQAALVSDKPAQGGTGFFGILAIMGGVLLLGLGGLAFALWSRNRIGAH